MKTTIIDGVPYLLNEAGEVFVYSAVPQIQIGNYAADTKILTLMDDWEKRMDEWVGHYRNGLKAHTQDELKKAVELQKAA
jgi:hypothetical protein